MLQNNRWKGVVLFLIAAVSWGAVFPIAKNALGAMDGFYLTVFRYGLGALVFAAILLLSEGRAAFGTEGRVWRLLVLGTFGFAGFSIFVFVGLAHSTPEHAAIFIALMPLITAVLSWVLRGAKLSGVTLGCIGLALFGVLLVVTKGHLSSLRGGTLIFDLMILLGVASWAVYTIGAQEFPRWSALRYTTVTCLLGAVSILVITGAATIVGIAQVPAAEIVFSVKWEIAYLVLIGGVAAVLSWNRGVALLGPVNGVLFVNLVPITAFTIGLAQGKSFTRIELYGAALTIVALIINNLNGRGFFRRRETIDLDGELERNSRSG